MIIKCPDCGNEIAGKECVKCGETTPAESIYCINCGALQESEVEETAASGDDLDFENRVLCSDGTCTGIIINGKCSECGKSG
jgi:uncharacterized OB-fold protein